MKPDSREAACPRCHETVDPRWDICRHCGHHIRDHRALIPNWAWLVGGILLAAGILFVYGGLKAQTTSCRDNPSTAGCRAATRACSLLAVRTSDAFRGRTTPPEAAVLETVREGVREARAAVAAGGSRFRPIVAHGEQIQAVLQRDGNQLPLRGGDLDRYKLLTRLCQEGRFNSAL